MTREIKCWLGFHKWHYAYAPFELIGKKGRVQVKLCRICRYKSPKALFIQEEDITD